MGRSLGRKKEKKAGGGVVNPGLCQIRRHRRKKEEGEKCSGANLTVSAVTNERTAKVDVGQVGGYCHDISLY